jgi:hypothetical protein
MPLLTNTDRRTRTTARECGLSFQRYDANLSSLVTIALENEMWNDKNRKVSTINDNTAKSKPSLTTATYGTILRSTWVG